jgi:hypothetical protein
LVYASVIGPPFVPIPPIEPPLEPGNVFGGILRDELSTDATASLLPADDPILETGDLHYGNLNAVKETDEIMPNAAWAVGEQLAVYVNGRDYLSDELDWVPADTFVGNWYPELEEGKLTFTEKKRYGRVLRYRFVGIGLRGLRFDAYAVNVYMKSAER